jgi:hypothetical protein
LLLNFNPDEEDQDFAGTAAEPWRALDFSINQAYREEYKLAVQEVGDPSFIKTLQFSWPSASTTLSLPASVAGKRISQIDDITSTSPGETIWIQQREGAYQPSVFWLDSNTLQWGTSGPGEDKTLLAVFVQEPIDLVSPIDVPFLIPERHRDLLVWSAAVIARMIRDDDNVPRKWEQQIQSLRFAFWNDLMQGQVGWPSRYAIKDPYMGT